MSGFDASNAFENSSLTAAWETLHAQDD